MNFDILIDGLDVFQYAEDVRGDAGNVELRETCVTTRVIQAVDYGHVGMVYE